MKCEMENCNNVAQKHHIVYRSQGGLNIKDNYKYLCALHHTSSNEAVHKNKMIDLIFKRELQEKYFQKFSKEEYDIKEISNILDCETKILEKKFKTIQRHAEKYKKEDIIRCLMGGKLY